MGFNSDLGLRSDGGTLILDPRPEHEVAPGTVHFAVLTALAEISAARAADAAVVPVEVSAQFLRRADSAKPLVGEGRVHKAGRTLIFADGEVRQEGEVVARASVTFARVG